MLAIRATVGSRQAMARKYGYCGFGVIFCFLLGCAPVLSQAVIEKSEPILFQDLRQAPENHIGKKLILGGTIIDVIGDSLLEVLQRPLGYRMEPQIDDQTEGRFLVRFDQKIDADRFQKGRKITLAVEVIGKETRPLDQTQYAYPLLRVREYHLWPERGKTSFPNIYFGFGVSGTL